MYRKRVTMGADWNRIAVYLGILTVGVSGFVGSRSPSVRCPFSSLFSAQDIYVINWEGCLADTVNWRIETGIQLAANVWPELGVYLGDDKDLEWLHNKLRALQHVLSWSPDKCVMGEYALATRLLVEEQILDGGRSTGKNGKYASRFHPREDLGGATAPNRRQSRPLTVGEINENWHETLRESLLFRYHCDRKDPIPVLRTYAKEILKATDSMPTIRAGFGALTGDIPPSKIVVLADDVDVHVAEAVVAMPVSGSVDEALLQPTSLLSSTYAIVDLLEDAPTGATVHVLDSTWSSLECLIPLFGDNIPRRGTGKCIVPDRFLSLGLVDWASDPRAQASATMNPWTRLVSRPEWEGVVSQPLQ